MEIRTAAASDLEALVPCYRRFIEALTDETRDAYLHVRRGVPLGRVYKKHLSKYLEGERSRILIAEEDGRIAGFLCGEVKACSFPISTVRRVGYVSLAWVDEAFRRKGVMTRLEGAMTDWFRTQGVSYAELNYLTANGPAEGTWTELGYEAFRVLARKKL